MKKVNTVTPDAAMELLPPGARIVASPGCGTPETLLQALGRCASQMSRPTLYSGLQLGTYSFLSAVESNLLRYVTWHIYGDARTSHGAGYTEFVPARASNVPDLLQEWEVNVALVRVSEPDADGWCNLGPSASYPWAATGAPIILAELDPMLPRTFGNTSVHVDSIRAFVECEQPTCTYISADVEVVATEIAAHVLELLPDDPTLQLGIGSVPDTIGSALVSEGVRIQRVVGMATDIVVDMLDCGVLGSGRIDNEPAIMVTELMGTSRLLSASDRNHAIGVYGSEVGHNPVFLSKYDRLISINSALEVDLTGQVNAEVARSRQISSVGGSADFAEAARGSSGGMCIVALPSVTRDKGYSRIVPELGNGAVATLARHMPDAIVTEYGVAWLRGRTLKERREALLAIAHPDYRDALSDQGAYSR